VVIPSNITISFWIYKLCDINVIICCVCCYA